jgi:hypothetical protein
MMTPTWATGSVRSLGHGMGRSQCGGGCPVAARQATAGAPSWDKVTGLS